MMEKIQSSRFTQNSVFLLVKEIIKFRIVDNDRKGVFYV